MASLSEVLTEAAARQASEVTLETGQPVVIGTARGPQPLGDALGEDELYEALTEVLGPEEQAELAVGNVLSFDVDLDGNEWTLVVEPGPSGIIVRGVVGGGSARSRGGGLELPPLSLDDEDEVTAPAAPSSARWKELTSDDGSGEFEMGIPLDDDDDGDEADVSFGSMETDAASQDEVSFADVEPDDELSFSDEESESLALELPSPIIQPPAPPMQPPMQPPMPPIQPPMPQVSAPRPGDKSGSAPTLAMSAAMAPPWAASPEQDTPPPAGAAPVQTHPPPGDPSHGHPLMRPGSYPAGGMPVPGAAPGSSGLGQHASLLEPGMLAFLRGQGLAEHLADALGVKCHEVTEDQTPAWDGLEPGAVVAVRCEDPSRHLGWILRRVEEGVRVVVETRALTPEGARRVLLGVDSSPRAESWLDQRPMRWFAHGPGGWTAL